MVAMAMPRLAHYLVLLEHWGTNSTALLFAGDEGAPKPAKQQQDAYEGTRQREANLKDARTAAEADSELEGVRHIAVDARATTLITSRRWKTSIKCV